MAIEFKTANQQMKKLRRRGMNVATKNKKILEKENYYKIINGYKSLFLDNTYTGPDEKYKVGTDFEELYAMYIFDNEIRHLFLKYILSIENNIKSVMSHEFSRKYGCDNYLKESNFNTVLTSRERANGKTQAQKLGEVADLVANIQKEISKQLSKNNSMISHSMLNHGYVPFWILVNTLTLGTVSTFYSYMKQVDQNDVGRKFNLIPKQMSSILFVLSIYRNACAHNERFYNLKALKRNLQPNMIMDCSIHSTLGIPRDLSGNYINGKNDLFAVVIIFKLMLSKSNFNKFFSSLKQEIDKLNRQLHTVGVNDVLKEMGFPSNWGQIKSI